MKMMIEQDKIVTSSNIFKRKTKSFDDDGIFSERIFGPVKDYKCKCGKLNSEILDGGKRCAKCNVLCDTSNLRFETFGYIPLPFMCIKPTRIKDRLKEVIVNVLNYSKTLLDPIRCDYNINQKRYLGINKSNYEIKIFDDRKSKESFYIPVRITGIHSLIFCLKYVAARFKGFQKVAQLFDDQIFMTYIKVIPPGIRPVSFSTNNSKSNKVRLSDINKAYISLINLNKSNSFIMESVPIDEDDWFDRIDLYFKEPDFEDLDEEIVEHMMIEYDMIASKYQFYVKQIYETLMSTISGKEGFIRHNILGKTVEFSGRSVIVCDPSLEPYQIGVSKKILCKLWMLYFGHWLYEHKDKEPVWCYDNITLTEYCEHKKIFADFLEWFMEDKY